MAKVKISEFSANPANNTDIDGINIAENCPPSGINDAIRELMAQLKDFQAGTAGDSFNGPIGTTTAAAGAFTTLSASGAVTLSGGTANGVAYLNGSKVLTTGSALTFDGSKLTVLPTGAGGGELFKVGFSGGSNYVRIGAYSGYGEVFSETGNMVFGASGANNILLYTNSTLQQSISSNGTTVWNVGGSEQMRLTSTGLGIGTSSPGTKLDVVGSATVSGSVFSTSFINTSNGTSYFTDASTGNGLYVGGSTASPANTVRLFTNGSERMRLDSSGNLGLGVTPSAWSGVNGVFEIKGNAYIYSTTGVLSSGANAYFNGTNWIYKTSQAATRYEQVNGLHKWDTAPSGTAGNAISFTQAMTLDASGNLGVGTTSITPVFGRTVKVYNAGSGGTLEVGGATVNARFFGSEGAAIAGIGTTTNTAFNFITNDTERARIDSSGNLLVGTTSSTPSVGVVLYKDSTRGIVRVATTTTSADALAEFYNPNGKVGQIVTSGSTTAYNTSSDYRLKENIAPMTGALAKVAQLKPVTYTWKADGSAGEGFIAHELAEVCPAAVTGEKDAVDAEGKPQYQGIDVSFLVGTLTAAIQELKAEFDAYKAAHP